MTVHPAWCEGAASEVQKCTTLGGANMPLKQWLNVWKLLWLAIRVVESSNPLLVLTLPTVSAPLGSSHHPQARLCTPSFVSAPLGSSQHPQLRLSIPRLVSASPASSQHPQARLCTLRLVSAPPASSL